MLKQAEKYGAVRERALVTSVTPIEDGFEVCVGEGGHRFTARCVLLATGVVNNRPEMEASEHDAALERGLIRYCPICDGYEVTDKRVGVIGTGTHGMKEALFLRGFTRDVTLIAPGAAHDLDEQCRATLEAAGIEHLDGPCTPIRVAGDRIIASTPGRATAHSTASIPRLARSSAQQLAVAAGARATEDGCLEVDDHQRTSVSGLFAAGDVVKGLDQTAMPWAKPALLRPQSAICWIRSARSDGNEFPPRRSADRHSTLARHRRSSAP